jgi:membrane associated rhomboid family serine protease
MLENRDYMREHPSYQPQRPLTIVLLVANGVFFIIQSFFQVYVPQAPIYEYFALSLEGLKSGFVWQLLTFQFMHAGLLHLLLNCWAIYVFGREIEQTLGRRSFLVLYLTSGIAGGLLQTFGQLLMPSHFGGAVVGASAGVFGLVAAFAMLFPERSLTMLLFFILPVTIKSKYLLLISAGIAIFGIVFPGDHVAHAAHLGGMVMGMFYIRQVIHWNLHWPDRMQRPPRRPLPREMVNVTASKSQRWQRQRPEPEEPLTTDQFLSREVDPILDKISQHGIHSLTERERKILDAARKKMEKK